MKQLTLPVSAVLAAVCVWNASPTWGGEHPEHPTATSPAAAEKSAASAGLLDGKSFAGEIGKSDESTGDPDDFVFKDGRFLSSACQAYGFNETAYAATEQGGVVSFTADVENTKGETMSWKGVVKGDQFQGTALYQTAKGSTEYWFKGALKAAGSKSEAAGSGTKSEHPTKGKKSEHPEHPR